MLNNGTLHPSSVEALLTKLLRKGKQLYTLKKLYLISKEHSTLMSNSNSNVLYFYFLLKHHGFHNISVFPQAEANDVLIDSFQSLINAIIIQCNIDKQSEYKISVYTEKYHLIDLSSLLLDYKGDVLFVKTNQISSNDQDSNKMYFSPKVNLPDNYNTDLLHISNRNSPSLVSNGQTIKNTLLKFRLEFNKTSSLRNTLTQRKCANVYYPIREKKTGHHPHIKHNTFRYHKYNFSFNDLIESGRDHLISHSNSNGNIIKTPTSIDLSSSTKQFPPFTNNTIKNKYKYTFNAKLYPIDQQLNSNQPLVLTHSQSCKEINVNRQLKNIQKYFTFKRIRSNGSVSHLPKAINHLHLPIANVKQEYSTFIAEIREYINTRLEYTISQSSTTLFNLPYSFIFHSQYKSFPFIRCQKEFIFYSYISNQFDQRHQGRFVSLKQIKDIKPSDLISYINEYREIINEASDNPIKIIHYGLGKKEINLSSAFFQLFILCYDYFDETQAALSEIIMMVLGINTICSITFTQFSTYYLYFKQYSLLTKERQYLFMKKIVMFITQKHNMNTKDKLNGYDNSNEEEEEKDMNEMGSGIESKANSINDIFVTFRSIFQISETLLKLLLSQYDSLTSLKIKRKQAKLDTLFEQIINYFIKK